MSPEQEVSLRTLIRDTIADADSADPVEIAEVVADRVPARQRRDALAYCLAPLVADMLREQHNRAMDDLSRARRTPTASAKVAAFQSLGDAWRRALDTFLPTADGRKRLADCTRDDLLFAARVRRDQAAASVAHAENYEAWAAVMKKHRVMHMGDLPEHVLATYLDNAA